jgi:asparagine synthase (glutamine-hydrolysing)
MKSNLQMLLHWEDRNSMACSIESRVPFLDYRLVEFSLNIPREYKINQGLTKRILRQAVKNFVPFDVCNRADKMGFVTPEELWAIRDNPELIRLKLEDVVINSCNLINENIGNIFDEMIAGKRNYDFRVWRAISFSEWVKCFSVNPNASP